MGMSITTNVAAMSAYRSLSQTSVASGKSLEKLSSGFRINRSADDAAGLGISQGLRAQIGGMTQAVRNTQDGISVVQIAEGALGETTAVLQRMRDLAVQGANEGSLTPDSKLALQTEMDQLKSQLSDIASRTTFNGVPLLDGNYRRVFQVGANNTASEQISLALTASDSTTLGVSGVNVGSTTGAQTAIGTIDAAIAAVSASRSQIGATQNQLGYTMNNLQTTIQNVTASRSNITDADLATEVTAMSQAQILTSAATSVLAQANSAPQAILKLLQ